MKCKTMAEKRSTGKTEQLSNQSGVLIAGCIVIFLQSGSFKACGVLFDNVVKHYETSNLYGGWVFTLQPALCFITAGIASAFLPKLSNRAIGVIGGVLFSLGFVLQGLFGQTLCHLFLFIGMSAAGTGLLYLASYMAYIDHFSGCFPLAYSVRDVSVYLGITVVPPLLELIRGEYGLNGAFLILGAIAFNGVLAGVLLKPCNQNTHNTKKETENDLAPSFTDENYCSNKNRFFQRESLLVSLCCISSLRSHPLFILFNILHALLSFNYAVWALFLVPYGVSLGYAPGVAVFLSTSGGLGGFLGKIVVIAIFYFRNENQIITNIISVLIYGIAIVGYLLFYDYMLLLMSSFLSGFSLAFGDAVTCAILPNYLCKQHLRQGLVVSYLGSGLAMQIGGIVAGAILDSTSSFSTVFCLMFVFNVVIGVLAFIMGRHES